MLIDYDSTFDKIQGLYKNSSGEAHKAYSKCLDVIADMQAIDAEPVKHGHWIVKEIVHCMEYDVTCSCCGFTFADNYDGYVDTRDCLFCMNCGAKMDGN